MEVQSSEEQRSQLNEDVVIFEILPRLPVKSLCRFKCVSKRWNRTISYDQAFIRNQSQFQLENYTGLSGLLVHNKTSEGIRIGFITTDEKAFGVPQPPLGFLGDELLILSSCNGLICCICCKNPSSYYVCNPVTKEWRKLPKPTKNHGYHTTVILAFDPSVLPASYKVICPWTTRRRCGFEIFSSDTGVWSVPRVVRSNGKGLCHWMFYEICTPVFVGGVIYWQVEHVMSPAGEIVWIYLALDLEKGCVHEIQSPPLDGEESNHGWLGELEGCLSFTYRRDSLVKVWILRSSSSFEWLPKYSINLETVLRGYSEVYPKLWLTFDSTLDSNSWMTPNLPLKDHRDILLTDEEKCLVVLNDDCFLRCVVTLSCADGGFLIVFRCGRDSELFSYHFKTQKLSKFRDLLFGFNESFCYTNSLVRLP